MTTYTYTEQYTGRQTQIESRDECFLTDRDFPGWFGDAKDGDEYIAEYADYATDADGNEYRLVWQFVLVRGEEPDDDSSLPWEDGPDFIEMI